MGDHSSDTVVSSAAAPASADPAAHGGGAPAPHPTATPHRERERREKADPGQDTLLEELSGVLLSFLEADCPVFLEGFGVLFPAVRRSTQVREQEANLISRPETTRSIGFEKCSDLTSFHREQYPRLIETRELVRKLYPSLPAQLNLRWTERQIRAQVIRFIAHLRDLVIRDGISELLPRIGTFYALHNRQGLLPRDWFAGADIFLHSAYCRTIEVGATRTLERPILEGPFELLEAACGRPVKLFSINLANELAELGCTIPAGQEGEPPLEPQIKVGVFLNSVGSQPLLMYCTDGLRRLAADPQRPGVELIFQLPVSSFDASEVDHTVPLWPARPLTMAWILLVSSQTRTLRPGAGLSAGVPLIPRCDTELSSIFVTEWTRLRSYQRTTQGAFRFLNVVGITSDEAEVAERLTAAHILRLLEYRGLDQLTKPTRSSVIARSVLAAPEPAHRPTPPQSGLSRSAN